jgi:hypothetical protein
VRAEAGPDAPRHWVGVGLASAGAAALMLAAGGGWLALVALALALVVLARGVRASLALEPQPCGVTPPGSPAALAAALLIDEATAVSGAVARRIRPRLDFARVAADVRAAADRNREHGWLEHPELAYPPPPPLEKAWVASVRLRGSGEAEQLRFASGFEPLDPEVRDAFAALHGNRTATATLWRRRGAPQPTLVVLHGHRQGFALLDAIAWQVRWLHGELGLDVAHLALPLHGPRSTGWRSGAGFLDGHPGLTCAALAQSVWDLRRLCGWLRAQGAPALGIAGYGLGGYVAALFASLDGGLANALLFAPVVDLAELSWRRLPSSLRAEARAAGLTEHWLAAAFARHAPLRLRPHVPHAARLLVAGAVDRVTPPSHMLALWEHWGRPACHWQPGGHVVWRDRATLHARVAGHLRATLAVQGALRS